MQVSVKFITFFESQTVTGTGTTEINLKEFLKDFFQHSTPVKDPVKFNISYGLCDKQLVKQAKECILKNIYLNLYFLNILFDIKYLKPTYELFKQTTDSVDNNQIARIIFLLHFSKSTLDEFNNFLAILSGLNSIVIVSDFKFRHQFREIYEKILKNSYLKQCIQQVIESIIGACSNYKFEETKCVYFTSSYILPGITGLHGFAGVDSIYINQDMISNIYNRLSKLYTLEEKLTILKINFVRLVIHETTHVALQYTKNDLNMSSPFKKNIINSNSCNIDEAGVMAENKVFKGRIDWLKTGEKKLDLKFCTDFLKELENNRKPEFNVNLDEIVLRKAQVKTMAIDMDLSIFDFFFE